MVKKLVFLAVLLAVVGLVFLYSGDRPTTPKKPVEKGTPEPTDPPELPEAQTVVDSVTVWVLAADDAPVAGAKVRLRPVRSPGDPDTFVEIDVTDDSGETGWDVDPANLPAYLTAEHPGHGAGVAPVTRGHREVVIRLRAPARAFGFVEDADGQPIESARVRFDVQPEHRDTVLDEAKGSFSFTAISGTDGTFEFRGLPPFQHGLLAVSAAGHATSTEFVRRFGDGPHRVVLEPAFRTELRVEDADGRAIEDARVVLAGGTRHLVWRPPFTERGAVLLEHTGDGTYATDVLPPDRYVLFAASSGLRTRVVDPYHVRRGEPLAVVVLEKVEGIAGHVRDTSTGRAVGGAFVSVLPETDLWDGLAFARAAREILGPVVTKETAEDGSFALSVADPSDEARLLVRATGYRTHDRPLAESVSGGRVEVDLHPAERVDVSIRVVDSDGSPVAGAIFSRPGFGVASGPGGWIRIEVYAPAGFSVAAEGFLRCFVSTNDLGSDTEVVLFPSVRVRGAAVDGDGEPVVGVRLGVEPDSEFPDHVTVPRVVTTGAAGEVLVDLPAETAFRVSSMPRTRFAGEARFETGRSKAADFRVVLTREAGGRITGRVRPESPGGPMPDSIFLLARDESGKAAGATSVGPDGVFELPALPPGAYRLSFRGVYRTEESNRGEEIFPPKDVLVSDGADTEVDLVYVAPPPRVAVTVRAEGGGPGRTAHLSWVTGDRWGAVDSVVGEPAEFLVRSGDRVGIHGFTADGARAGVLTDVIAGTGETHELILSAAGRVRIPQEGGPRLVIVRTPDGAKVLSRITRRLPLLDGVRLLPLPPGAWLVSFMSDPPMSGEPVRVEVRAGETVDLE